MEREVYIDDEDGPEMHARVVLFRADPSEVLVTTSPRGARQGTPRGDEPDHPWSPSEVKPPTMAPKPAWARTVTSGVLGP